jgi:N utilization substance protein B
MSENTKSGAKSGDMRRASARAARSRSRSFAVQALYQVLVGHNPPDEVDAFTRELSGFHKADSVHFDALLHGCAAQAQALDALILPLLDRKMAEISPIEHAVLWIGCYEMQHCLDIPWRVVINECIELAKEFGGTDGHKYVNAVLNGLAPQLRALEVQADKLAKAAEPAPAAD